MRTLPRFVTYCPNLTALQAHVRLFRTSQPRDTNSDSNGKWSSDTVVASIPRAAEAGSAETASPIQARTQCAAAEAASKTPLPFLDTQKFVWPSRFLGPLTPVDKRFMMPGAIGFANTLDSSVDNLAAVEAVLAKASSGVQRKSYKEIAEELTALTSEERRKKTLEQAQDTIAVEPEAEGASRSASNTRLLECLAHDCPHLLRSEFQPLFTNKNLMLEKNVTVVTLTQRTNSDMSAWSETVSRERELLLDTFVSTAAEICARLREDGYWADFIDPSSGQPFYGAHTNDSLPETDERMASLGGFEIDDLTCCRVVRHHKFGTRAYVGCIFTNVPHNDAALHQVLGCTRSNAVVQASSGAK